MQEQEQHGKVEKSIQNIRNLGQWHAGNLNHPTIHFLFIALTFVAPHRHELVVDVGVLFFSRSTYFLRWFCAQSTLCRWRKYFSMFLISFHIYKYTITYRYIFPVELAFFFLKLECQHSRFVPNVWVILYTSECCWWRWKNWNLYFSSFDVAVTSAAALRTPATFFSQPLLSSSTWKGWKLYSTTFLLARCDVNTRVAEQSQIMHVGGRWKQRSNDSFYFFLIFETIKSCLDVGI